MALMKIKKIRKKPKAWLFPSAIEREYVKAIEQVADKVGNEAVVFCEKFAKSDRLPFKQDGLNNWLQSAFVELLQAMMFWASEEQVQNTVRKLLGEADRFNKRQFQQTLKKAYGVDIFTAEPWLDEVLKLAEMQNISLIKSIPTQLHEKLQYRFVDAVQKGKRWEEVAKEVQELTRATKKRARLIARDQIGKLNGQLTKARQEQIGVKSYIWRTSLDERVRKLHVGREGQEFAWDNPPNDGHPGEPILCRCYAEAVLPDLDDLLAGTAGNAPVFAVKGGK
ncbi:phage head morphogenesis protein [Actinobacillus pleuropneumoniae serovar 4 str. M62]|nr:phage head morphogenesis protein [Actinobacillus pleuropneumoniae serovar 4 str. M62]